MLQPNKIVHKYLRGKKRFPHLWCPGCSLGIITGSFIRAIHKLGYKKDDVALVSGIGCTGRMPVYLDFNTLHTTHGRALPFATGVKLGNPDLNVFAVMGDGDASAIGGNHLIHAARRNLNVTAIIVNNNIYGMTGGQYSPSTKEASLTTTSPYGMLEPAFDISELCAGAGAPFVARTSSYNVNEMINLFVKAAEFPGFAVVEVVSSCPTYYGRFNKKGDAVKMLMDLKDRCIPLPRWSKLSEEEKEAKIPTGILQTLDRREFMFKYKIVQEQSKEFAEGKKAMKVVQLPKKQEKEIEIKMIKYDRPDPVEKETPDEKPKKAAKKKASPKGGKDAKAK